MEFPIIDKYNLKIRLKNMSELCKRMDDKWKYSDKLRPDMDIAHWADKDNMTDMVDKG